MLAILFSIIVVIRPFKIGKFPINIITGSIFVLFVLLLSQVIDWEVIKFGVLGNDQLQPWKIILIFFTVAYISISLDLTGVLDFLAYKIIHKAKGDGVKLFFFIYFLACTLTVFTSNDIVILTLTPIIFYLSKYTKINITPLLFAEFFGANIFSMFLYISNPTNIIIGNTLGIGFFEYTRIMWLPTIVAALTNLILLYWLFKNSLTKKIKLNYNPRYLLRSRLDAIISSFLLIFMLVSLIFSQTINISIWVITSIFAVVFIIDDLVFALFYKTKQRSLSISELQKDKRQFFEIYGIPKYYNEFWTVIKRIPWQILPFILTIFILVAGLNVYGAIDWLAVIISKTVSGLGSSIVVYGLLGGFLANIINNQPMTVLFSNIFINDNLQISQTAFQGGTYATIIASNLGANLTLIGALAGLMWKKILKTKGIYINYWDFAKVGFIITPAVLILSLITLYFVLAT